MKKSPEPFNPIFNSNKLKLGVFGQNGAGLASTKAPERFDPTWENALEIAVEADNAGLEALVPYARWRPFGPDGHVSGNVLEPTVFAAAIAARTSYTCVMTTVHVPLAHPLVMAKQMATIDHIANGRFGLNVVCGWFKPEMEMFGTEQRSHTDRYKHADEWTTVLKRALVETEAFNFDGDFIKSVAAYTDPKPLQKPYPPIMNAGGSAAGRAFSAKHADLAFLMITSSDVAVVKAQIAEYRDLAKNEHNRNMQVWSYAFVIQRETVREATDYLDYAIGQNGDWVQVDEFMKYYFESANTLPPEILEKTKFGIAAGAGAIPLVGTAETIAARIKDLSEAGLDGLLLSWIDYKQGIIDFNRKVLPILEKEGLREPFLKNEID